MILINNHHLYVTYINFSFHIHEKMKYSFTCMISVTKVIFFSSFENLMSERCWDAFSLVNAAVAVAKDEHFAHLLRSRPACDACARK